MPMSPRHAARRRSRRVGSVVVASAVAVASAVGIGGAAAFSTPPRRMFGATTTTTLRAASGDDGNIGDGRDDDEEWRRRRRTCDFEFWGVERLRRHPDDDDGAVAPSRPPSSSSSPSPRHSSRRRSSSSSLAVAKRGAPSCPSTFRDVADAAFRAVAGTVTGRQRPDPNAAGNAMHRSVLDYRAAHPPRSSSRIWGVDAIDDDEDDDEEYAEEDACDDADDKQKRKRARLAAASARAAGADAEAASFSGRMGIEIDCAKHLFDGAGGDNYDSGGDGDERGRDGSSEGRALRVLSLEIALRLASYPWVGFEEEERTRSDNDGDGDNAGGDDHRDSGSSGAGSRPVAVYYNSLEQALLAARELRRMKLRHRKSRDNNPGLGKLLERIHVCRLGKDGIPAKMQAGRRNDRKEGSRYRSYKSRFSIDPSRGMVLVVNPTDCEERGQRDRRSSPLLRPAPDAVDALQRTLVRASSGALPAVVMTPRLTELPAKDSSLSSGYSNSQIPSQSHSNSHDRRTLSGQGGGAKGGRLTEFSDDHRSGDDDGHDRDRIRASAQVYGGSERPTSAGTSTFSAPWLMRDLAPPVYAWVGRAVDLTTPSHASLVGGKGQAGGGEMPRGSFYSRVALAQSSMDVGHPWHMFAVRETAATSAAARPPSKTRRRRTKGEAIGGDGRMGDDDRSRKRGECQYEYMASTKSSSGRPTRSIVRNVFEEWSSAT